MLDRKRQWTTVRVFFSFLMAAMLAWGLVGCGGSLRDSLTSRIEAPQAAKDGTSETQRLGQLTEVAPPPVIQQLSQSLEAYQPQVTILSPASDEVLQDTTVSVRFQVQDLPIFKDPELDMGPHLHVILDNQPYQAVYDPDKPLVFEDLPPGTHTLRVFASRPWHESFKNEGAYAQTTFHVFTKTTDNNPDPALPLLTYSRPKGSYGAEPIMLDFYLTNAPLHLVAQENPNDDIADWRIRVTANGESFVLDRWQPVYLKGFKPGKNWVQLEFLDEQGNPLKNVFNNTVRLIEYKPKGKDTLSRLVRGELSAEAARGIVEPGYEVQPTPSPVVTPTPSPSLTPSPTVEPTPIPPVAPPVEETPTPEAVTPEQEPTPVEETPTPEAVTPEPESAPVEETPTPEAVKREPEPTPAQEAAPSKAKQTQKPKFGGFFNRFRRPAATPSPSPEQPEVLETPSPAPTVLEEPEPTPELEASPTPSESPTPVEEPTPEAEETPTSVIKPVPIPIEPEKTKPGGFFGRFRRPAIAPTPLPERPQEQEAPSLAPVVPSEPEPTPEPEASPTPSEPPAALEEPTPTEEASPTAPATPEKPRFGGFFNRFRRPTEAPSPSPKLQEELEAPSGKPTVVPSAPESQPGTTPAPEELVIPSEPPASTEETTSEAPTPTSEVEPSPVIEPVPVRPIQPEKPKSNGLLNRFQSPSVSEPSPDTGLPPTLPEIVDTPSPATPEEAPTTPESPTDQAPAAFDSGTPETPNPEPAAQTPKLDLKEVLISPPAAKPSLPIIQAPADAASDIPSRFLKKSAPNTPTNSSPTSEVPEADLETIDVPSGGVRS